MAEFPSAPFDADTLAKTLFTLRKEGRVAPTASFALPGGLTQAMDAQNALARLEEAGGHAWKVAMTPDGQPVVAPLHPYEASSTPARLLFLPGMKFEVEIAVRLGRDLPPQATAYTRSDVLDAISEAHIGCELLATAVQESGKLSFPLYLADRIGNRGYALGPAVPKALVDGIGGLPLKVTQEGETLYDGPARHPAGDTLDWLVAYANDGARPQGSLKAGAIITTGALSGAMPLAAPGRVDVLIDGRYAMSVILAS
ncbi:fumarylacetoacetate hydrolase family protein [Rhizobium puerariae]|uniref:Fumarylacetoacetate hydrolase family protein n=1 Tax=Rhizobium puerariae TaxID=1585791 RepID=A0ABV6AEU8_9HYPH